jgi:hypothetical protein
MPRVSGSQGSAPAVGLRAFSLQYVINFQQAMFRHAPHHIVLEAGAYLSMVAEGVERRRRHGVHGVGTEDRFDVQDIAPRRVFRPGAAPQQAWSVGAVVDHGLPARATEDLLGALITVPRPWPVTAASPGCTGPPRGWSGSPPTRPATPPPPAVNRRSCFVPRWSRASSRRPRPVPQRAPPLSSGD